MGRHILFRHTQLIFQIKPTFFWLVCSTTDSKPECLVLLQTRHVQTERCINADISIINPFLQLCALRALFLARQQLGHRQDSTMNNLEQSQSVAWKLKKEEEKKQYQGQTVSVLSEPSAPARFLLHAQRICKKMRLVSFARGHARVKWMKDKECRCRKLCIPAALNTVGSLVDAGGNLMDQVGHEKKNNNSISCKPSMKTGCK